MTESELRVWASNTRPFDHLIWVGKDTSIAEVKEAVLALLAVVENDQPKCPECNGTGVREISSSGDSETGFEREWDACDCGRVPGVNTGATDRRPSAQVVNQGGTMTNMDALREYERRQGQMGTIAELLASEYGGDSADWEDIAYKILDRMAVVENDQEAR